MKLIDSHCHITDKAYDDDRLFLLNDLSNFGVRGIVNPSCNLDDTRLAIELSREHDNFYACAGFHPEYVDGVGEAELRELEELAADPHVVAIGEIGLDYYWRDDNKDQQKYVFIKQLEIARRLNKPVVIHQRDSRDDVLEILEDYKDLKLQIHCFTDDLQTLDRVIAMGFYISIGGVVTFNSGENEQNAARNVPIDRLMLETDGPYLTPEPYRGLRNDPRHVVEVAKKIADLRDMKVDKLAKRCYNNTMEFFGL